jgi:hypothetical protein
MKIRTVVGAGALLTLVGTTSWFAGAKMAHADEPVYVGETTGFDGIGCYASDCTTAYRWSSEWSIGDVPAGAWCSTVDLPAGALVTQTIQADGPYRKCE